MFPAAFSIFRNHRKLEGIAYPFSTIFSLTGAYYNSGWNGTPDDLISRKRQNMQLI